MKLFVGADHRGYSLKEKLVAYAIKAGYSVVDTSDAKPNSDDDFPVFASRVATALISDGNQTSCGLLLCGSGQGMVMAANRFKGIRACIAWDSLQAQAARHDDDSNVLVLPADILSQNPKLACEILDTFLNTPFANLQRYRRRINQMDDF